MNRIVMLLSSSDITGDTTCLVLDLLQQRMKHILRLFSH